MKEKDKELLMEAIDNYDAYSPSFRTILRILVDLSIDNVANITVIKLSKISSLSREIIYQALRMMEKDNFIELSKPNKGKINAILLKDNKLNQITQYYNKILEAHNKYKINAQ